jgi:ABC-type multidrug transport system fused ATPase/permease subunit
MSKSEKEKGSSGDSIKIGKMMRIIMRFIGDQRGQFLMAGLILAFEAATAVLVPLLFAYIINYLAARLAQIDGKAIAPPQSPLGLLHLPPLFNPDIDTLLLVTIGIVLLTMVNSFADSVAEIYLARGGRKLGYNLRVSLYSHLQKLSLAFHDQRRTGDILTRVTSDVAALEDFIISSLSDFVGSALLIIFILVAMLLNAWQVALVAAVIIPVMALISNYFTQRIKTASKKRRTSEGELASAAQEMLSSIRVIQTYGLGSYEQAMFSDQSQRAMDAALEAASYQARFSWVVSVLGAVSTAAVIWMAVWLIFHNPISVAGIGLLTAYIKYIQDMFKPTKRIIQEWNTFGKLYASVERIGDLMDIKPSVQDVPGAVETPQFLGHIEFRDVTFTYPSLYGNGKGADPKPRPTLQNISFEIEPGQVVAVVGHTGAGKSTIAQLLPRLYDPSSGQILIDGQDMKQFTLESLRAQMSMVLQESILFSGSVVENIAYGRPDASGPEIIAASKQANAHEFIERLPAGYYTMLGERGSNLSGGQRQRLAIARAFIRNTPILIMDEPTTGLDAESIDLVLRALHKLMKGKTTIIISHDMNLIRDADKIIVINHGEIEQIGTHDSLIRAGGLYATLYTMQYGATEVGPDKTLIEAPEKYVFGKELNPLEKKLAMKKFYETINYDLPHSDPFQKRVPGLAGAFNADRMQNILQDSLFGQTNGSYTITSCLPGKAIYLGDQHCSLQYDLTIRDNTSGENFRSLLNARLFPELAECRAYLRKQVNPLVKQMSNRPEIKPYSKPAVVIDDLNMVVSVFPIDGMLPSLVETTNPKRMAQIFNDMLPDSLSGNFLINDIFLDLAHYGRYQRCVLRYQVEGEQADTHEPQKITVYGKVDGDGRGGLTVPVINALRERLRDKETIYPFRVPTAYGYLPDLKLLLMEALPGKPFFKQLLRNRLGEEPLPEEKGLTLEDAIATCAQIAASLHHSGIKIGPRNSLENKVSGIQKEIQIVQEIYPELGNQLCTWLEQAVEYAHNIPEMMLCFSHGDFTYTQLIFDGKAGGLVDFDTICQAEPALDLGQFLAYQRLAIFRDQSPEAPFPADLTEKLCEIFIKTYIELSHEWVVSENDLRNRVYVYELISLIRLTLHSWQKLKGSRLEQTLQLLEERMTWLTQVR